jgi:IS30 family transposase
VRRVDGAGDARFAMLMKVRGKDTISVVSSLQREIGKLPSAFRLSLTWDRGMELARHHAFTLATKMAVYLCDSQSLWQRGTNENTNSLLRPYFPIGADLRASSQSALDRTALELNQRPRETLGFRTSAEAMFAPVALTA